jgi:hypothetical protein
MMAPVLVTDTMLKMRANDLELRAERSRRARGPVVTVAALDDLTAEVGIRRARPADHDALVALARVDSRAPLAGTVLVAELDGALVAARSLEEGTAVADPFSSSAGPAALLAVRAEQIAAAGGVSERRRLALRLRRHPA